MEEAEEKAETKAVEKAVEKAEKGGEPVTVLTNVKVGSSVLIIPD